MREVLHFSGGRDSVATLYVLKPNWEHIMVMWCNTLAAHDDTIETMRRVRKLVPHFMEVQSNQPESIRIHGYPADIVPRHSTLMGQSISKVDGPRFQSALDCCARNLWAPMAKATRELGARIVYRGQRRVEQYRALIGSGYVDDSGVQYIFPIEDWTDDEVRAFIDENCPELWPTYYDDGELISHDCWDCTGWLDVNVARIKRLPEDKRTVVLQRLRMLDHELKREAVSLRELLEDDHARSESALS